MAVITAGMVKELREKTDAPMMECKKALSEADGDMSKAEELLRIKLGGKANKAAGRVTAEGVLGIYIAEDGKLGAIIEVNCETDFVAKNDDFLAMVKNVAELVAKHKPADIVALSALNYEGRTVEEIRTALVGKIGENLSFRRFVRIEAQGKLVAYVHGGAKLGVLLDLIGGDEALGKDLAMHIAASKPQALSADGIDPGVIESERRVALEKAREAGKTGDSLDKKVDKDIQKFLKEVTLLGQVFVKASNGKQTVEQLLQANGATVASFVCYLVGEGIEKKSVDFAAEVAAQQAAVAGKS